MKILRYTWSFALALLFAFGAYELKQTAQSRESAVLVDKKTGRRFEVSAEDRSTPIKERLERAARRAADVDLSGSGDLESRKRRAYGVLLGTVAATALFLLYIRRSMKG